MGYIKGQKHTPSNQKARKLRIYYVNEMGHPSVKNTTDWVYVYDPEEVVEDNKGLRERVTTMGICIILPAYWVDNDT